MASKIKILSPLRHSIQKAPKDTAGKDNGIERYEKHYELLCVSGKESKKGRWNTATLSNWDGMHRKLLKPFMVDDFTKLSQLKIKFRIRLLPGLKQVEEWNKIKDLGNGRFQTTGRIP